MKDEISEVLRPVQQRLWILQSILRGGYGLAYGFTAACMWMIAVRFFPFAGAGWVAAGCVALALASSAIWTLLRQPTELDAAGWMDKNGMEDRMCTALRFRQETSMIPRLQREDACSKGRQFVQDKLATALPLVSRRIWQLTSSSAAAFVLLVSLFFWPNPMEAILRTRQADQAWVDQQEKQAAELLKEWERLPDKLAPAMTMEEALRELEKGLSRSQASSQALEKLEDAMNKLQTGLKELEKQQLRSEQWAKELQRSELLQAMGEAMERSDGAGIREAIAELGQQVTRLSSEQKEKLAQELDKQASTAAAISPETERQLREQLGQLAAALRGDEAQPGSAADALAQLQEQLAAASAEQLALEQQLALAAQQAGQLAAAGLPQAQALAAEGAPPSSAWAPGGLAEQLAASAEAAASPAAAGAAPDASPGGTAAGSVSAAAGPQPGSGSGADAGAAARAGAGGTRGGAGEGSRSLVTTPRERAGTGGAYVDGGPLGSGSGEVSKGGEAPATDGVSRPYEEVFAEYEAEASGSLNRSELPQNMQKLVRDYFMEIQPQRD